MLSSALYAIVLLAALCLAFAKGARAERRVAWVILIGNAGTIAVLVISKGTDFSFVSAAYVFIDVVACFVLCGLAVSRPSWMTILLATCQINGTLGHIVKLIAPDTIDISYAILLRIWGWPMVATMLAARFNPNLRRVLRQSDLMRLPSIVRPPLTVHGLILRGQELSKATFGTPRNAVHAYEEEVLEFAGTEAADLHGTKNFGRVDQGTGQFPGLERAGGVVEREEVITRSLALRIGRGY